MGERVFEVEPISLHYARAVGNYTQKPGVLKPGHKNVVKEAVHFWRAGGTDQDALRSLNLR